MEWRSFLKPDKRTGKGSRTGLSEDPGQEQVEADPGGSRGRTENSKFQLHPMHGKIGDLRLYK